eukprot:7948356-Alexandrium_andersonii.AAC.2
MDELTGDLKKLSPSAAGKLNYLAQKRPDIQYESREVCRFLAKPNSDVYEQLVRAAEYVRKTCNFGVWLPKVEKFDKINVFCASNWAAMAGSRKSATS